MSSDVASRDEKLENPASVAEIKLFTRLETSIIVICTERSLEFDMPPRRDFCTATEDGQSVFLCGQKFLDAEDIEHVCMFHTWLGEAALPPHLKPRRYQCFFP